jgi:hypothetical protein
MWFIFPQLPWAERNGEDERYLIADDVVDQLKQHGDPWDLSRELPPSVGKAHPTPPMDKR